MSTHKSIVNLSDVELKPPPAPPPPALAGKYEGARVGFIGPRVGAQKLGYNMTALPPGKRAFPMHNHRVNEEMFFVLEGEGEVRIGDGRFPIRQGDVIACPPGGPETAHQIVNTGARELRFLAVSTKMTPEIAEYPESKKFGVMAEVAGPDGKPQMFRFLGRTDASLPYYDGET
jgi:uncharacterized cupin superfamily protein